MSMNNALPIRTNLFPGGLEGELGWLGPDDVAGEDAAEGQGAVALQPCPQQLNPFL